MEHNGEKPELPHWLMKEENYVPLPDHDAFVNKSVLSFLSVLSRIRAQAVQADRKFSVNAFVKVVFTLAFVLLVSLAQSHLFVLAAAVYVLVLLSLADAPAIIKTLKAGVAAAAITFVILLPAAFWGGNWAQVTAKVFISVTAVNLLSRTTKWSAVTGALKMLFVPDIFIFVLDIAIQYLYLLGEFALAMLGALRLRSVGKNKGKYASVSGIAGTLFLRSKEMAEEMVQAMECRGFTGEYAACRRLRFCAADALYSVAGAGMILLFIYCEWSLK